MSVYLGYARTGKEFEVADEARERGADVWCGRRITGIRSGKNRRREIVERPALPNYLFIAVSDIGFRDIVGIKYLAHTLMPLTVGDRREMQRFCDASDEEYKRARLEAERLNMRGRPLVTFKPGETVEIIEGPLADRMVTFRKMVEAADGPWLEVDAGPVRTLVNPAMVRRA